MKQSKESRKNFKLVFLRKRFSEQKIQELFKSEIKVEMDKVSTSGKGIDRIVIEIS